MADLRALRRLGSRLALGVGCTLLAPWAIAAAVVSPADLILEEHVNRLTTELRCLVCQNQTIADSQAELALQLKAEVRSQLARGATDEQVREFMVERYGQFVLYRPPLSAHTVLLWAGPALLLLLGAGLFGAHWRESRQAFDGQPDSVLPDDDRHKDQP